MSPARAFATGTALQSLRHLGLFQKPANMLTRAAGGGREKDDRGRADGGGRAGAERGGGLARTKELSPYPRGLSQSADPQKRWEVHG